MIVVPFVLVVAAAALLGLGWNASNRALHPGQTGYAWKLDDYPGLEPDAVTVESSTGATLAGRFFKGRTPRTIVLLHGYGGNQDEMLPVADELHEAGYGVFTFDQRGSGKSTGETTFGAREQDDLISVVDYLVFATGRRPRPARSARLLDGRGHDPAHGRAEPRLKAVVADSAWSDVRRWLQPSVGDVFVHHPRDRFTALSLKLAELRTGTDLDDLRPAEVIDRIGPRPLLLVHGSGDEAIPAAEAERNFEAAKEPKKLVVVPGAGHGETTPPGSRPRGATSSSSSTAPSRARGRPSHERLALGETRRGSRRCRS